MIVAGAIAALTLAACDTGEFLAVEDPDAINPEDVRSAAGANAVRIGALARFTSATSGGEMFLLSGLFVDEWVNGDTFIHRWDVDRRAITLDNTFLTTVNRQLHRARVSGEQAVAMLRQYSPNAPGWQVAEMHLVQAYIVNLVAEHYCSGIVLSTVVDGGSQFGSPITTTAALERSLGHTDDGLAVVTGSTADDVRIRNALRVTRGRILMNLDRPADAAVAVADVPTSFVYRNLHSVTTSTNQTWVLNNSQRRYSVSNNEGTNGLNFATANDPRLPVCHGGDTACRAVGVTNNRRDDNSAEPFHVQLLWPARESPVTVSSGIEARMIQAEAQLRAGQHEAALATLNAARATVTGLLPLTDAGTDAARIDQLFREKAFWLYGRGHRVGDMRRLIRQYGRDANAVFPTGAFHKAGTYGSDVTIPLPLAEANNPNVPVGQTCMDRNP
jgi:starch-binding outer membrane protein, SusD/RagB family